MYTKTNLSIPLTDTQKEILVGTVLGDTSLTKSRNKRSTACLRWTHSVDQHDYSTFKASFFESVSKQPPKLYTNYVKRLNRDYTKSVFTCLYTTEFFDWYNKFYIDGVKIIPNDIEDMLTPRCLAFWYMDDGSIETVRDKRKGVLVYTRNALRIHTNGFTHEETERLCAALNNRYQLKFAPKKADKGKHRIVFTRSRETIEKFIEIVNPFMCESMLYKTKTSYEGKMRKHYTDQDLLRIMRKLDLRNWSDFKRYRHGKRIYDKLIWHFGSVAKASAAAFV